MTEQREQQEQDSGEETQQQETNDQKQDQQRQQTFDREYVETLRKENAATRTKLRKLEEAEEGRKKAELSEVERLKAEKETAETNASETLTKANQRAIRSEARVQALEAGVKPERVAAVLKLSDLSSEAIEVDDDGEPDAKALKKVVEATLKEYPEFKGSATVGGSGSNPGGDGNDPAKNPWSKEHFNLTEQGNITKADPVKAERLKKAAAG